MGSEPQGSSHSSWVLSFAVISGLVASAFPNSAGWLRYGFGPTLIAAAVFLTMTVTALIIWRRQAKTGRAHQERRGTSLASAEPEQFIQKDQNGSTPTS
jgi:hypothetical protein